MASLSEDELLFAKFTGFCEINEQFRLAFKQTERNLTLSRQEKNDLYLHYVAKKIFPRPTYFQDVVTHFAKYLPRLLSISIDLGDTFNVEQHKINCVLLGRIVHVRKDLQRYALEYFEKNPAPFMEEIKAKTKRSRVTPDLIVSDLELVQACYSLLRNDAPFYGNKWTWSEFIEKYFNDKNIEIQWIACHCISLVTHMSENQLQQLITSKIPLERHEELSCTYNSRLSLRKTDASEGLDQQPVISISKNLVGRTVEISGVYVPALPAQRQSLKHNVVIVDSTYNNLKKVAFALSSNKAICLQGPVGSGKTTLVEYVADKTGRKLGEDFVKVQLGDQTDSKMLLGTYRCTDVPGEFIWQPGVVTQAVIEGHWLLLEDIDSASMDIASVLSSLLENGNLTVPGYRDSVPIAPGFQLFCTQRLVSTATGHHKKHSNAMSLLEKHLRVINVDPLTSDELKVILTTQHPQFVTIQDRMVKVFLLFSKTDLELHVPKTSRLISTRDFFKWCSRAAKEFDISSQASALKILQDAIDVFCCSYPKQEDALNLAKEISTHLGIINQKAEYFFKSYKPLIKLAANTLEVGRTSFERNNERVSLRQTYYFTRPSAVLLERIMTCVNLREPILLVGETGTGKTSTVQYLANTIGQKLVVINMNQQSDSVDLLGGFKPVDLKFVIAPIRTEFERIFCDFFKVEPNKTFLGHIAFCFNEQRWSDLVKLMMKSYDAAIARLNKSQNAEMLEKWQTVGEKLYKLNVQLKQKGALAFAFIEGSLVKAVEEGYWVLLDEINLANAETLECLSGLLEGSQESLCLLERGDKEPVKRHPNFTLFACMNPSTDVGKRDLPPGLRNRFTEFFVDELTEKNDLLLLVGSYLEALSLKSSELEKIVAFYLKVRKETEISLTDGLGHKPHFSLRSLCRALSITARNPCGMVKKSLYEAFCLSFLTQLDSQSYTSVERMISKYLVGDEKALKSLLKQPIPAPKSNTDGYVQFEGYWVKKGTLDCVSPDDYILTNSVRKNLKDLVRIVSIGGLPVLLQGDTSVGKTSLITYLAKSSGNKCVRINNHEHTDLQEYIGSYVADSTGKLVFREGVLVEAMRKGHWIILDELNLAPSDVLEALNRVLDDNRELFIPETQETVKANPSFMLFATQNPPGSYGGRKMLSRAFRNRFVELHFNEIPPGELEVILHRRCQMAPSYAKKMINVMSELQMRRRGSAAFAGKKGFITLRDLFRWGERYRLAQNTTKLYDWDQHLADEGYLVLAGKVRRTEEKQEIITVLQKQLKREVIPDRLFTLSDKTSVVTKDILSKINDNRHLFKNIVWTYNMRQLAVLVAKAFQFKEPVLLVGETGGGKTTVCKLIAELNGQQLVSVNCHMHTESSDFIGGLRPVRDHTDDDTNRLFEWVDGPLIHAMQQGEVFLADEISLADDSVLERLNSLLEPERTLLLAEKATDMNNANSSELVVADSRFHFIGTMNPGGDFGKKELSPALRNRFTEIWCEACTGRDDLIAIIEQNIGTGVCMGNQQNGSSGVGSKIMDFVDWFAQSEIGKRCTVSIRDILTWVSFINVCAEKIGAQEAYRHGVHLTFLDGLGSGSTGNENPRSLAKFKHECEVFVDSQLDAPAQIDGLTVEEDDGCWGIKPFYVTIGRHNREVQDFSFSAPTTTFNTLRLLRGMQLNKAILLEGSPGVGKTSLVTAVAKCARHKIFRVNLSDQTDISDLFGADLPVEGGTGGQFAWRDGPLLQALRQGDWILLDELNLASQSVLEGLNACLDHRGEIFIPELGKTFKVEPGTRFFACQNPLKQGGSRRGLPQSFLNRFIQVHVSALTDADLRLILVRQFPDLDPEVVGRMLEFNGRVQAELDDHSFGNKGSPWEFNLRDLTRWCEATIYHHKINPCGDKRYRADSSVQLIYGGRMRTLSDKARMSDIFQEVFGCPVSGDSPVFYSTNDKIYFGDAGLDRTTDGVDVNVTSPTKSCLILRSQLAILRSLVYCVNLNWMSLLVGNSASGKSTVVRVLANIVGKSLKTLPVTSAMDTTEILGGFEQTDYSRHLDEVAKETEAILLKTVRNSLRKDRPSFHLLGLRENYSNVKCETQSKHTMNEETRLFLKKVDELERILAVLRRDDDCPDKYQVEVLQMKVAKMRESVKNEGSLNAGGKFEWVDSVLIKCLQDGSWLLVDNVNLCSAAVLDRLNALLEPRGVLTVSERGVDSQGQMVEITPHPDFRLFLTMDPKNGEISRAMRNRGVEIYVSAEIDNDLDVKSLVSHKQLKKAKHIDSLLHVHAFVSDMILGEKPNVGELLQAAASIAQQIGHGVEEIEAFYDTAMEIYYKSRTPMEFGCNDFGTVIRSEIADVLSGNPSNDRHFCDEITLKTDHFHAESTLQKIKQQAAALQQLEPSVLTNEIVFLVIHFYGITTRSDVQMRLRLFNSLFDGGLCEVSDALHKFVMNFKSDSGDFPIDFRWIPDTDYPGRNRSRANTLILGLHVVASLKKEQLERVADDENTLSLRDYMIRRKTNVDELFDDVLIAEFLDLIERYDTFVLDSVSHVVQLTDEDVMKILSLITWRMFLHRFTSVNVKKISALERHLILTNFKVHYRWFFKYAVDEVGIILNKEPSPELKGIMCRINKSLEQEFSLLHKFGRSFQKCNDRPLPRTTLEEIEFATEFQLASKHCDDVKYDDEFKKKIVAIMLNPSDELHSKIKELKSYEGKSKVATTKYDIELHEIVDSVVKLKLKHSLVGGSNHEFKSCLTLPADLISSLELYRGSKDAKLLHELTRALFQYMTCEPGLGPNLIHRLTATLVGNAATKFGNFRELQVQHRQMSLILWRNLQTLNHADYDNLQNERKLVAKSFESFVDTLAESMAIEKNNLPETLEACLKQLSALQNASHLSDSFIKHLRSCSENYPKLNSADFHLSLCIVYKMHMELSYVRAVLNSRLALIDPSAKKVLKKKYCAENITTFEELSASFVKVNEIYSGNEKTIHPHHQHAVEMIKTLTTKGQKLKCHVAVRNVLYDDVVKLVNHGFSTILSPKYVDGIMRDLDKSILDLISSESAFSADYRHILKQHEAAVPSFTNLLSEWSKFAASYPDVMQPLLSNLSEFVYGFKSGLWLLKKLLAHKEFEGGAQQQLVTLVEFPRQVEECEVDTFLNRILETDQTVRLLKCRIQDSFNECVVEANLFGRFDFSRFTAYVKAFVGAWNEQEKRREREEKEAEALYRTMSKCEDKSEDEQIEDELKEMFPNYHERDFSDLRASSLQDEVLETPENRFIGSISHDDVKFVVDLHTTLVCSFTKSEWLNPDKNKTAIVDFLYPLVEKYELFKTVCDKVLPCLDYRMNGELLESCSVLLAFIQNHRSGSKLVELASPFKPLQTNRFDFYKDSNVEEVKSSFHILEELKLRVAELQREWPDHPTLQNIATVTERIYDFDVTSPLSRFLTGFEILLSKCHEWEEVAHSGVSLSQISQNITQQIITWRKMELGVWKDLLNSTFRKMNEPTYKWWLYLYNVMEQFVGEEFGQVELIEALQNFVTRSNLAEFETRLRLLYAFHCHAVHSKRTPTTDAFIAILWNVHSYFQQFAQVIANKIKDLRAPIEKKLRDYVKIVRWKDVNYWSVKETVDKTHKTLHKFVREFRDAVSHPVLPQLVNTSNKIESVGIWDRPQRNLVKVYHYTSDPANYVAKDSLRKKVDVPVPRVHEKLQEKGDSCFTESRKLCKDSISAMRYPKLIQSLDNLVAQIIETSTHLQGLEVDTTLPKPKQKSSAKNILHQKHRALADLFKTLAKIGLSFRSGIVEAKLKAAADDFLLKPIDIAAGFGHINYTRKAEKVVTIWDGCETYYLKSLMRADVLDTALKTPAPDLGLQNITRCRGFSANLLTVAHKHKSLLIESSNLFYCMRHYTTQMTKLCDGKKFSSSETVQEIQTVMKRLNVVMSQLLIFINSCPEEDFTGDETCRVVLTQHTQFIQYRNDELWEKSRNLINEIINASNKISIELEKSKGGIPHFERNIIQLQFVPLDLDGIQAKLDNVTTNLNGLSSIFGEIHATKSLTQFISELDSIKISLTSDCYDCPRFEGSVMAIQNLTDNLVEKISNVIQTVSKKYPDQANEITDDSEDVQIEEEHLKSLISEHLEADLADLCLNEVLSLCQKIAEHFFNLAPPQLETAKLFVSFAIPLLEQLLLYHQYFLTQQVSAYRVICKLNSVLLNIFIDLASKGFCIPPEFSDEMDEGAGKQSNGLGLGEGQGERDVSDRIESEDQLDDAQPADQEKQKEDDPDCKEDGKGIEMSEDFDSKLQDVDRKEEDDDDESNSDADEQMGETEEGADKQNKENFRSDDEDETETNENVEQEERGEGEGEGEPELGAKDEKSKPQDKPDDSSGEKEENKKEINELEEPEYDDEQTDPYHGNQPELPEPEPMDLPDDLQLDEGQEQDNDNQNEENPFDIDAMKDDNPFENKEKDDDKHDEGEDNTENQYSSDDEEVTKKQDEVDESDRQEENEESAKEKSEEATEDPDDGERDQSSESGMDQTHTNEENVEAMEVENADATDKTMPNQSKNQQSNQSIDELCQEDKPDKEGVGQSQMEESSTGHSAQTSVAQELQSSKRQRDEDVKKHQKPGESNAQRSLGNVNEPVKKKLKTMDTTDEDGGDESDKNEEEAEIYKHIRDAKESATQVLDTATKEQVESQKPEVTTEEEQEGDTPENVEIRKEEDEIDSVDVAVEKPEKTESKKNKLDKKQHPDGDVIDDVQEVEVEGEVVKTFDVARGGDTTYNTLYDELKTTAAIRLTQEEANLIRSDVERQLSSWTETPSDSEADKTWQKISSVTASLAQDLSEQLRLVLEPTQASRLRGDFRTGRRINMRKVIPYIASQFRKDKIWLRRTKPSKREYQIVLAIDDSASMADNHSKELAFESVALISKALFLLESGQLGVVSFGENIDILHKLADQFSEKSGVKLLQRFKFDQNKTCVAKLVNFVGEMFAQCQLQSSAMNAKLLVIVSDGRGVFSEGEGMVRQAVRRARLENIFMVFVIIDNPENKNSILDIRMPSFKDGKLLGIKNYMDVFPFSFYIILRDINSLPNVLSDALRQWFEVVSNLDKQ